MFLLALALLACPCHVGDAPAVKHFKITVVDEQTGRGVPLVELSTVHGVRHFTDSHGIVAFHEPGLMGQTVYFHVKSHGYEFPKDGFGFRGRALEVKEGGSVVLKIKRLNVAERLYRITGAGIYRDSVLVGQPTPLERPLLNGQVVGSDTVLNAVYRGKLYWFWGDTNRASYPLGNYEAPGATSLLPGKGGLDPRAGVNLTYFLDDKGFARKMTAIPGKGPTWITSVAVLRDGDGPERMFAVYVKIRGSLDVYARGLAEFSDKAERFERVAEFDLKAAIQPGGHTFQHVEDGVAYVYFANPYPLVRVRADPKELGRQTNYQAFTCLKQGSRLDRPELDRAPDGGLRYGWKTDTPPLSPKDQARLLKSGLLKPGEALTPLQDADTGAKVFAHAGSVYWNAYRGRWVMIAVQEYGTSLLGEVWYAEADTPLGPWVYARKVVTHDRYSFYNPKQHPVFDRDGGRALFFEGTYTHTFSGNTDPTPRYEYNQIMYQLDLADPRLVLPVPVYQLAGAGAPRRFGLRQALGNGKVLPPLAFFAADRARGDTVPVYAENVGQDGMRLQLGKPADDKAVPLFHALPATTAKPPATAVALYEHVHKDGKQRAYAVAGGWSSPDFIRAPQPLCLVWRQPLQFTLPWHPDG